MNLSAKKSPATLPGIAGEVVMVSQSQWWWVSYDECENKRACG